MAKTELGLIKMSPKKDPKHEIDYIHLYIEEICGTRVLFVKEAYRNNATFSLVTNIYKIPQTIDSEKEFEYNGETSELYLQIPPYIVSQFF